MDKLKFVLKKFEYYTAEIKTEKRREEQKQYLNSVKTTEKMSLLEIKQNMLSGIQDQNSILAKKLLSEIQQLKQEEGTTWTIEKNHTVTVKNKEDFLQKSQ